MVSEILGQKLGMTQIFKSGECIPVTVIQAGPCLVTQIKTAEKDGYCALQLGYGRKKASSANKPESGHFKKAGVEPKRFVREISWDGKGEMALGGSVDVSIFEKIRYVDIVGTSKGKGFQGTVRRHGFAGGPKTHGQSDRWRAPGSIGSSAYPSRVLKGMRMAGHMGNARCTARNLELVDIDVEKGILAVRGSIPGHNGSYVIVKKSLKNKA